MARSILGASPVLFLGALRALFSSRPKAVQVTAEEAHRIQKEEGGVILDVREPHEWRVGHAPEAMHIPLGTLNRKLKTLPRDKPIVVTCASGMRSRTAAKLLLAQGFPRVLNLKGGMTAWRNSRLPLTK